MLAIKNLFFDFVVPRISYPGTSYNDDFDFTQLYFNPFSFRI